MFIDKSLKGEMWFSEAFAQINHYGLTDEGMNRLAYTDVDEHAHRALAEFAQSQGLSVRWDLMGNLYCKRRGRNWTAPRIATGSHLDTVPNGGQYDGVAGVLAGLYALLKFKDFELEHDLELIVFRAEESSRFGFACMGSKNMTGQADYLKWKSNSDSSGMNVFDAMRALYYPAKRISDSALDPCKYHAFIELHIEQGRVLETLGAQIGIVEGIAAPSRYRVDVTGHSDHSGATPMGMRQDAVVASAKIIAKISELACDEACYGSVGTVGRMQIAPNAINVIAGDVEFFVDIRGVEEASIERIINGFKDYAHTVSESEKVHIEISELSHDRPVVLSTELASVTELCAINANLNFIRMNSGAGHDAMYMSQIMPAAMIFVPSKNGVSHHKDEYTELSDIATAADLLIDMIRMIDERDRRFKFEL